MYLTKAPRQLQTSKEQVEMKPTGGFWLFILTYFNRRQHSPACRPWCLQSKQTTRLMNLLKASAPTLQLEGSLCNRFWLSRNHFWIFLCDDQLFWWSLSCSPAFHFFSSQPRLAPERIKNHKSPKTTWDFGSLPLSFIAGGTKKLWRSWGNWSVCPPAGRSPSWLGCPGSKAKRRKR